VLVALDISTASDAINHQVLIDRREAQFGVCDAVSRWLRSYLTSRYQFVKLGQQSSDTSLCSAGVPQGSVLGTLLITAYTSPVGAVSSARTVSRTTKSPMTYNLCWRGHQTLLNQQLVIALNTSDSKPALQRSQPMHDSSSHLVPAEWLATENDNKSEVIVLGTPSHLSP